MESVRDGLRMERWLTCGRGRHQQQMPGLCGRQTPKDTHGYTPPRTSLPLSFCTHTHTHIHTHTHTHYLQSKCHTLPHAHQSTTCMNQKINIQEIHIATTQLHAYTHYRISKWQALAGRRSHTHTHTHTHSLLEEQQQLDSFHRNVWVLV
jgi:hypothetical protein